MKVAFFTPYLPYPADTGGKIRSYHLLRALTARFEVDLYSVYYGEGPSKQEIEAVCEYCRRAILFRLDKRWRTRDRIWRVLSPLPRSVDFFHTLDSLKRARDHLSQEVYDIVIADEICMTPYAELAPELPRIVLRQKVDHLHYLEVARARHVGLEKALDLIEAHQLGRYERAKMPFFQAYLACSDEDARIIGRDAPDLPALVIPNGADLSTFVPSGTAKPQEPVLLYVGSMNYYPNIDAVLFFFSAMYEPIRQAIPGLRVQIVGHNPPPEIQALSKLPGVEVTGSVPDVRPYYARATVLVVPLRLGGGSRLKIVEAMAMDLPVVSTTVGAQGLEIHPGENILIADDPSVFTKEALRLLLSPDLRGRIAEGGRLLARCYDWTELTKPLADVVQGVAEQWGRWEP